MRLGRYVRISSPHPAAHPHHRSATDPRNPRNPRKAASGGVRRAGFWRADGQPAEGASRARRRGVFASIDWPVPGSQRPVRAAQPTPGQGPGQPPATRRVAIHISRLSHRPSHLSGDGIRLRASHGHPHSRYQSSHRSHAGPTDPHRRPAPPPTPPGRHRRRHHRADTTADTTGPTPPPTPPDQDHRPHHRADTTAHTTNERHSQVIAPLSHHEVEHATTDPHHSPTPPAAGQRHFRLITPLSHRKFDQGFASSYRFLPHHTIFLLILTTFVSVLW